MSGSLALRAARATTHCDSRGMQRAARPMMAQWQRRLATRAAAGEKHQRNFALSRLLRATPHQQQHHRDHASGQRSALAVGAGAHSLPPAACSLPIDFHQSPLLPAAAAGSTASDSPSSQQSYAIKVRHAARWLLGGTAERRLPLGAALSPVIHRPKRPPPRCCTMATARCACVRWRCCSAG